MSLADVVLKIGSTPPGPPEGLLFEQFGAFCGIWDGSLWSGTSAWLIRRALPPGIGPAMSEPLGKYSEMLQKVANRRVGIPAVFGAPREHSSGYTVREVTNSVIYANAQVLAHIDARFPESQWTLSEPTAGMAPVLALLHGGILNGVLSGIPKERLGL